MALTYEFGANKSNAQKKEVDDDKDQKSIERYDEPGHLRYIIFDDNKGKIYTEFYSYLNSLVFDTSENKIIILFPERQYILIGQNLLVLLEDLAAQNIRRIKTIEGRYMVLRDNSECLVNEINVNNVFKQ